MNGNGNQKVTMYLIAALLAGGAGTAGYQMIYPPRPNPFTSVDAEQMEQRLISRIARLEGKVEGQTVVLLTKYVKK